VAGVNRGLEGLACDVFAQLVQLAQKLGDPIIERAVDMVLADEITHVRMGSTWMRKLTEDDPARRQMALDFQHHIDELFNFGGARQDGPADQVSISISREARKMAGFTDEEIDRLVKAASASAAYLEGRGYRGVRGHTGCLVDRYLHRHIAIAYGACGCPG
jgi:uncharacterized ferritin-like protein (DUF455 family)